MTCEGLLRAICPHSAYLDGLTFEYEDSVLTATVLEVAGPVADGFLGGSGPHLTPCIGILSVSDATVEDLVVLLSAHEALSCVGCHLRFD